MKQLSALEFSRNDAAYSFNIKDDILYIECTKLPQNNILKRPFSYFNKNIPLVDIISSQYDYNKLYIGNEKDIKEPTGFTANKTLLDYTLKLDFITRSNGLRWKMQTLKFDSNNETLCTNWTQYINSKVKESLEECNLVRPSNLLIFINPYGGRHKAEQIYSNIISPIFEVAQIKQTVIKTEHRNHAREYVEKEAKLTEIDGIIAIGGDGMLSEVINGLVIRTQSEKGLKIDNTDNVTPPSLVSPSIRLGLIPAGSTNCISFVTHGTSDPATSALHIVAGDSHPLDLSAVYNQSGKFLNLSFSMTSYGFFGNVLTQSENMRRLGPSRYDIAGIQAFMKKKAYPSEIQYLPSLTDQRPASRCRYPCSTCLDRQPSDDAFSDRSSSVSGTPTECMSSSCDLGSRSCESFGDTLSSDDENSNKGWKTVRGKFVMVNSVITSCANAKCPEGLSPSAHISDGNCDLIMVRDCAKPNFLRYLMTHTGKGNRFNFPFVEVQRVRAFRHIHNPPSMNSLQSSSNSLSSESDANCKPSTWNTDGEIISDPNITVWVQRGLVNIFGRGIESV